jgi:hypothetical protein
MLSDRHADLYRELRRKTPDVWVEHPSGARFGFQLTDLTRLSGLTLCLWFRVVRRQGFEPRTR